MRRLLSMVAGVAVAFAFTAAPAGAGGYGSSMPIWCSVNTTGLPGGTVNHRLALMDFNIDPQTNTATYAVWGINTTTNSDSWGYGHAPGSTFPITATWTDGPTLASSMVRQWHATIAANLTATVRITDINTNGTFSAVGNSVWACQ